MKCCGHTAPESIGVLGQIMWETVVSGKDVMPPQGGRDLGSPDSPVEKSRGSFKRGLGKSVIVIERGTRQRL